MLAKFARASKIIMIDVHEANALLMAAARLHHSKIR